MVETAVKERDEAVETARRLLEENLALKAFLKEEGLIDESGQVIANGRKTTNSAQ